MSSREDPLYDQCRALPGVTEDVKWGDNLVFSVGGKMFAVFDCPEGAPFSFRVDPEAFALLTQQPGIRPAPYLAKHSWVQVDRRARLPEAVALDLLHESHAIVAARLPKRLRAELGI